MTWLYIPSMDLPSALALEPSNSDSPSPSETPIELWVLSNRKLVLRQFGWRGWTRRSWVERLSGTISQPSMASRGADAWTSSLAASRVSHSAWLDDEPALTTNGGYGKTPPESLAKSSRGASLSRTYQASFMPDCPKSYPTLPRSGSMRNGELSARQMLAPLTFATDSGCWPTPDAGVRDGFNTSPGPAGSRPTTARLAKKWVTPTAMDYQERMSDAQMRRNHGKGSLDAQVARWPTPKALDIKQVGAASEMRRHSPSRQATALTTWPTPSATEPGISPNRLVDRNGNHPTHTNQRLYDKDTGRVAQKGLTHAIYFHQGQQMQMDGASTSGKVALNPLLKRRLNPEFWEALMNLPIGWTGFMLRGTAYCHWLRQSRSHYLRIVRSNIRRSSDAQ